MIVGTIYFYEDAYAMLRRRAKLPYFVFGHWKSNLSFATKTAQIFTHHFLE
jgi:hypothetical protein